MREGKRHDTTYVGRKFNTDSGVDGNQDSVDLEPIYVFSWAPPLGVVSTNPPVRAGPVLALNLRTLPFRPPLPPPDENPELGALLSTGDVVAALVIEDPGMLPGTDMDFEASPGTTPAPDLRAIKARMAPSHLISSSSPGAHNNSVRFVVMILKVWALPGSSASETGAAGGDAGGCCRC